MPKSYERDVDLGTGRCVECSATGAVVPDLVFEQVLTG